MAIFIISLDIMIGHDNILNIIILVGIGAITYFTTMAVISYTFRMSIISGFKSISSEYKNTKI
jgi:hypothetical protein